MSLAAQAHTPISASTWFLYDLFSWDPRQLFDKIFNTMEIVSSRVYGGLEKFLDKAEERTHGRHRVEFEHGCARIRELINNRVDSAFERLEVFVNRNIFNIPEDLRNNGWVRTPTQENVDFTRPKEAVKRLDQLHHAEYLLQQRQDQLAAREAKLEQLRAKRDTLRNVLDGLPQFSEDTEKRLRELLEPEEVPLNKKARTERDSVNDQMLGG